MRRTTVGQPDAGAGCTPSRRATCPNAKASAEARRIYATTYEHGALGKLTIASNGRGIVGLWLEGQKYFGAGLPIPSEPADERPELVQARAWLDRYFAGDRPDPRALPLEPQGTPFQRAVWDALLRIPSGELRTYAELADEVARSQGRERGSARAAGAANGRNPISIIIPCHRVVGSDGSLTGYAGGIGRKLWLLEHEGVDASRLRVPRRGTAL